MTKRALDLAVAVPGLIATAPLIGLLAVGVRLTSPGPAFYLQRRVGRWHRPIRVVKLRTMVADADRLGPAVTAARDPRVTPLGAWLRRTKLDELPQLWNVVTGDMSLVGPRPEAERYVAHYRPEWAPLHSVRPGITDPASLAFRDEESLLANAVDRELAYVKAVLPPKLGLSLMGIAQSSRLGDLRIIARTAAAVLRLRKAEHPAVAEARNHIIALNREAKP